MLIGLCGGICAGKSSIASYLVNQHDFTRIHLRRSPLESAGLSSDDIIFDDVDALLEFVTLHWRKRWVTTDIWNNKTVDTLIHRPFFLLVSVDAPVTVRWQRFKERCAREGRDPPSLETFVTDSDDHLYTPRTGLAVVIERAQLNLLNPTNSLSSLHASLKSLDLPNGARLRPSWDQYFMQLADLAAHRSNCMKRRVGCVIVREKRVISTGYNGTPRGMENCNEGGCPRCNSASRVGVDLSTCLCLHAEENALLEAGRDRIGGSAILYCNTCPCLTCSVKIAQVGISEVVYNQGYLVDTKTAEILAASGVRLRQFSPPREGLVDLSLGLPSSPLDTAVSEAASGDKLGDVREILDSENFVRPLA